MLAVRNFLYSIQGVHTEKFAWREGIEKFRAHSLLVNIELLIIIRQLEMEESRRLQEEKQVSLWLCVVPVARHLSLPAGKSSASALQTSGGESIEV